MDGNTNEYEAEKAEFLREAAAAFDRTMKEDQEQVVTFDQMEDRALEVGTRLEVWLMEKLLAEAARKKAAQAPPCCPRCQKPLRMTAVPKKRRLRGRTGDVSFQRLEGYCPSCRKAFFPLDQNLKLGVEGYAPALLRKIVSQGGRYAFGEAAHNLEELAEQKISAQHVMRLTERIGAEWAAQRDREIEAFKQNHLARSHAQAPTAAAASVMLDGGRVQTREEPSGPGVKNPEWHEPKYGCFTTLDTQASKTDPQPEPPRKYLDREGTPKLVRQIQSVRGETKTREQAPKTAQPSVRKKNKRPTKELLRTVIATMAGVEEFGYQVAVEVYKRGLDLAVRKACVCDGQKSNWSVWEEHLKEHGFIPILDFLHLLTYVYAAAQAQGGTGDQRWERYAEWMTWAWQGKREALLLAINAAAARAGSAPADAPETDPRRIIERTQTYVTNNIDKMDYRRYRKLGLPVSSAPVESTIKQFNKRVKGSEKFWRSSAAEAVLQIRAAQLSRDNRDERLWAMPRPYRAARHKPLPAIA